MNETWTILYAFDIDRLDFEKKAIDSNFILG